MKREISSVFLFAFLMVFTYDADGDRTVRYLPGGLDAYSVQDSGSASLRLPRGTGNSLPPQVSSLTPQTKKTKAQQLCQALVFCSRFMGKL